MEYQKIFEEIGLNQNESIVYELLLKEGAMPAGKISKLTELTRTNTYNVLNSLSRKGVLSKYKDSSYIHYEVEHPTALQELLVNKKKQIDNSQSMLTSYIDSLISDYNLSGKRPGVFRFEGKAGLERSYNEMLKDRHDIDIIMDRPRFRSFIGKYNEYFVRSRKRYQMKTRVITPDYDIIDSSDKQDLRAVRYIPRDTFPFEIDLKITRSRIVITTLREENAVGITIIDAEIARNFMLLFELVWNLAKTKPAS